MAVFNEFLDKLNDAQTSKNTKPCQSENFQLTYLDKSMYDDLQMTVKLSNGMTPFFSSLMGVRQGCNLSPLLFDIFVNDIFDILMGKSVVLLIYHDKPISRFRDRGWFD